MKRALLLALGLLALGTAVWAGGTSSGERFVNLVTDQTVAGLKTWTGGLTVSAGAVDFPSSAVASVDLACGPVSTNTASTCVLRDGSGNFAAGTITAALTGTASTATALAANGANCGAGTFPLGVDTLGAVETCSAATITGAGSIALTGAWSGTSTGTNTGDIALAAFGASPTANAASLSGQTLTLQPASVTQPGGVSTVAQEFNGAKTFDDAAVFDAAITVNGTINPLLQLQSTSATVSTEWYLTIASGVAAASDFAANFGRTAAGQNFGAVLFIGPGYTTVARRNDLELETSSATNGEVTMWPSDTLVATFDSTAITFDQDLTISTSDITGGAVWSMTNTGLIRADATTIGAFSGDCFLACPEGQTLGAFTPSVSGIRSARITCTVVTAGVGAGNVVMDLEATTCTLSGLPCSSAAGTTHTCDAAVTMAAGTTYDLQVQAAGTTCATTNPQLSCNVELALTVSP